MFTIILGKHDNTTEVFKDTNGFDFIGEYMIITLNDGRTRHVRHLNLMEYYIKKEQPTVNPTKQLPQ